MKKFFNIFLMNALLRGSLINFAGSLVSSFGVYLFHFAMGRMLGPIDYGILESLISLSYYLSIPMGVLTIIIVKYISQESSNKDKSALFINRITKVMTIYGLFGLAVFLMLFPLLKNLLRINSFYLFFAVGINGLLSIYLTMYSSVLQGIMKFFKLCILNFFTSWSKFIGAVLLVILGLKVNGAITAIVISSVVGIILGYQLVVKYVPLRVKVTFSDNNPFKNITSYSFTVLISNLCLISLYTSDIILARYFLSPVAAGQYASLSVLGKIIYFASSPVVSVMFPMVSERQAKGELFGRYFWLSFLLVMIISLLISAIYFVFPRQMINILFGKSYLDASSSLGLFAIFITLYSLCATLINFYLSISKTKQIFLAIIFAVLQIILINLFHQTISQIIWANIITLLIFLVTLLLYYPKCVRLKIKQ